MIKIKPDRCGYTGYTCTGIGSLHPIFTTNVKTATEDIAPIANLEPINNTSLIDNYYNIPKGITGFVSVVPLIYSLPNMATTIAGCYSSDYIMKAASLMYAVYAWVGKLYSEAVDIKNDKLPIFNEDGILSPGILEVMANPLPSNIDLEGMPDFDMVIDGLILSLYNISKWQDFTNQRIDLILDKLQDIGGGGGVSVKRFRALANLLVASNYDSSCSDFKISWKSGPIMMAPDLKTGGTTKYSVSGGTVQVNGQLVSVRGATFTAPFDVCVELTKDAEGVWEGTLVESASVTYGAYIGSVNLVCGGADSEAGGYDNVDDGYCYYQLVQGECILTVDYIHDEGSDGFVYLKEANGGVAVEIIDYEECPEEGL